MFQAIAELLDDLADQLEAGAPIDTAELATALHAIDDQARRHRLAGAPLSWHPRRGPDRRAIDLAIIALANELRRLGGWLRTGEHTHDTVPALRVLAATAENLAEQKSTWAASATDGRVRQSGGTGCHPLQRLQELLPPARQAS